MKLAIRFIAIAAALLLAVGLSAQAARADVYLFGSSGSSANYLDVTTGSGTTTLSTAGTLNGHGLDEGWWSGTVFNSGPNTNYLVGTLSGANYNDFFTFDIHSLIGHTVTSADLKVYTCTIFSTTNVTYSLYDVSTDPTLLNSTYGQSTTIYNDLGTGVNYGNFTISPSEGSSQITLDLDSAAIADLNTAINNCDTYFSIGGTLTPGTAVPEPSTLLLVLFGLVGLAAFRVKSRTT